VEVIPGTVTGLEGESGLAAVLVQVAGETRRLPARALFVQSGRRPGLGFAPEGLVLDAEGRAVVDAALRCSLPGLYAVGDARFGSANLASEAIADGRAAAQAVLKALGKLAG
jgi:thioredoxin reductase (NADPH)